MQAGRFWQAVTVRLRRCTLMLVALYLQPNLGPVDENMRRLAMLWKFLALTKLPWVIMGDWHCEPADLIPTVGLRRRRAWSSYLRMLQARVWQEANECLILLFTVRRQHCSYTR